jgi:hypothetical protein
VYQQDTRSRRDNDSCALTESLAIRRARARAAVSRIRAGASARGDDRLTVEEIDSIVAEVRRKRAVEG